MKFSHHQRNRILLRCLAMAVLLCGVGATPAGLTREYSVKLAFLYKFANYVECRQCPQRDHVTIGILGRDPFGKMLDKVAARRKARGKQLRVLRFASMNEYQDCDILFVSRSVADSDLADLVTQTQGKGVLLVGENPGFVTRGGIMNFAIDSSGKTAIQLNIDAARKRDLKIDARLMRVCDIVDGGVRSR